MGGGGYNAHTRQWNGQRVHARDWKPLLGSGMKKEFSSTQLLWINLAFCMDLSKYKYRARESCHAPRIRTFLWSTCPCSWRRKAANVLLSFIFVPLKLYLK